MAKIQHLLDKIRTAIYGKEVRGSLADGLEAINKETEDATEVAVNVEQRQDAVEQQFDDLLNEWTSDKPISNEETIAARTNRKKGFNYKTLGERLDAENEKVAAQSAHNNRQIKDLEEYTRSNVSDLQVSKASREELYKELNTKADKTYVDASLGNKVDKGGASQVSWGMLDQNAREQILGDTPPAVVGPDSVGEINLIDGSVTTYKLNKDTISHLRRSTFVNLFKNSNIPTSLDMGVGSVIQIDLAGRIKSLYRYEPTYQTFEIKEGHKYYGRFNGNVKNSSIHIIFDDGTRQTEPITNDKNSQIITADKSGKANIGFQIREIENGINVIRHNQVLIDLTTAFGKGNEPNIIEVEKILDVISGGWLDDNASVDFIQNAFMLHKINDGNNVVQDDFLPSGVFRTISNNDDKEFLYYDTEREIVYALDATVPTAEQNIIYKSHDLGRTWQVAYISKDGRNIRRMYTLKSGYHLMNPNSATVRRVSPDFTSESDFLDFNITGTLNDSYCIAEYGDVILYAEYGTGDRLYRILKSTDDGKTWSVAHDGTGVRHWHSVQVDPYTGFFWACGGDTNEQSRIVVSKDRGDTWEVVYGGTQQARACGLVFYEDYVMWGMDTAGITPLVLKLNKYTGDVEVVGEVPYRATTLGHSKTIDGLAFGWARIEGNSQQKENAVLWVTDGYIVKEVQKFNVMPNVSVGGFTRGSMIDNKNRWFTQSVNVSPKGLSGFALPTGLI